VHKFQWAPSNVSIAPGLGSLVNIESLSIDQMRAALAVAELGSFSDAARRFNRAQSAVSYAVSMLEHQLGVALFNRSDGAKPKPTATGRVLLREMEALVRQADEIKKQARDIGKGLEHELGLTIDSLFPISSLADVLGVFAREFPTVKLRLNIEAMGAVQKEVLEGRSTLGIIGSLLHLPPSLIGDALRPINRLPVTATNHPLAKGSAAKRLPHRILLDHIQILQSDRSELTEGRDFMTYTGRTWRVSDLATKHAFLKAGLGWGYMPEHDIVLDIAERVLSRVWIEGLRDRNAVPLVVVRRRDRVLGPAAQWMLMKLMETFKPKVPTKRKRSVKSKA
jgi:DNA-binding transcriptional LysR family regulator